MPFRGDRRGCRRSRSGCCRGWCGCRCSWRPVCYWRWGCGRRRGSGGCASRCRHTRRLCRGGGSRRLFRSHGRLDRCNQRRQVARQSLGIEARQLVVDGSRPGGEQSKQYPGPAARSNRLQPRHSRQSIQRYSPPGLVHGARGGSGARHWAGPLCRIACSASTGCSASGCARGWTHRATRVSAQPRALIPIVAGMRFPVYAWMPFPDCVWIRFPAYVWKLVPICTRLCARGAVRPSRQPTVSAPIHDWRPVGTRT